MSIKRSTHNQVTPSSTWTVTIQSGGKKARPLAAYTPAGNSLEWDSWVFRNGELIVDFGIDEQFGELDYEFQDEVDDNVKYETDGNIVNITVNQGMTNTPS